MQEDLEKQVNLKLLSDFMHCIVLILIMRMQQNK
jgi:hypothetical protein